MPLQHLNYKLGTIGTLQRLGTIGPHTDFKLNKIYHWTPTTFNLHIGYNLTQCTNLVQLDPYKFGTIGHLQKLGTFGPLQNVN